jgi:hypothetical protein
MVDIVEYEDQFQIIGNSEELEALGHALILKSKLGDNLVCLIKDNEKKPIAIEINEYGTRPFTQELWNFSKAMED